MKRTPEQLAEEYNKAKSEHKNALVRKAYEELSIQCAQQFLAMPAGIKIHFVDYDPYKTSKEMFDDIDSGHLEIFEGGNPHPILTKRENAIFRAVHDYYGHYLSKASFSYEGEIRAWKSHRARFRGIAIGALNTETVGQVSAYFYGANAGEFGKQKAFIMEIPLDNFDNPAHA